MANISITYTFSNGSTADATEVNTNFQDVIDGTSDGTKDFSINALTCAGTATLNGAVNLGNATTDDITVTGRIASDIDPKTAASNTLGDATQTWQALYVDNGATDGGSVYFNAGTTAYLKSDASGADLDVGGFTGLDLKAAEIKRMSLYDEAKSASYTITDADGVSIIYMTTGASDRTVTLPTAADNAGRVITVRKVDSGAGRLLLTEEGTDAIDGYSTLVMPLINDFRTVHCDGTTWHTIAMNETSVWTSYTPTITGGTTGGTLTAHYRRVGESMEVNIRHQDATWGGSYWNYSVPSTVTINTGVTGGVQRDICGVAYARDDSATTSGHYAGWAEVSSTTAVRFYGTTAADGWYSSKPFTWNNGADEVATRFVVPISEWAPVA